MSDETDTVLDAPQGAVDPFDMSDEQLEAYESDMVPESDEDSTEEIEDTEELEQDESIEEDSSVVIEDTKSVPEGTEITDKTEDEQSQDEVEKTPEIEPEAELDYKAEYEKLMAPFKANGKEITTENIDEVIKLKQMGANYTKKMVELKPHLKVIKMLEKNKLLDDGQLNYLIDLSNKDPKAIAKLIKDSGIDPLTIDQEEEIDYIPSDHTVKEKEYLLDEALAQIESTPTANKTLDIVGNQWDKASSDEIAANPKLLIGINEQMSNGIYDKIAKEMDKQQMFGGLENLTSLQAYREVGRKLYESGAFDEATPKSNRSKPVVKQSEATRKLKKRAASSIKTVPKKRANDKKVNFFDLSEKQLNELPINY